MVLLTQTSGNTTKQPPPELSATTAIFVLNKTLEED